MFPEYVVIDARNILTLSEKDQFNYWLEYIAVHYHHGNYLGYATERSKQWCFRRWIKSVKKLSEEKLHA